VNVSGGDPDESISSSTNASGLQTPSKKVYYLACSVCRWSTRDIRLVDQPTLNSWKAQDNIHEGRFNELLQHYKQIATRERQERDRKRYSTVKLRSSTTTTNRSSDKYGLLTPLTRRGIRTSGMLKTPTLPESLTTTNSLPKSADTIEQIEPLDENFFFNNSFDFNKLTTITQRLNSVEIQPFTIDQLYPLAKHFTSKQSKRCKECDHNVLKPEPSPKLIKFKLHQMALFFIPEVWKKINFGKNSNLFILF
jgi:dynactin-4